MRFQMMSMSKKVQLSCCFIALAAIVGCDAADEPDPQLLGRETTEDRDQTAAERVPPPPAPRVGGAEPAAPIAGQEQQAMGTIEAVDLDASTFTLNTGVDELRFTFSDATEIDGAAGLQGLAQQEGTLATVSYTEASGMKTAVRIEIQ